MYSDRLPAESPPKTSNLERSRNTAVIVAGGRGTRMGGAMPKQFIELCGTPILMHTMRRFADYDPNINLILVLPADEIPRWKQLCAQHGFDLAHRIVAGGEERFHSVRNALALTNGDELVAIHDGVRPFVSLATIARCFERARSDGAAIPVADITESLRRFDNAGQSVAVNRSRYKTVQTPQTFRADILRAAYEQEFAPEFTDDASAVERFGYRIATVEGNRENIKITSPFDLKIAETIMNYEL
jgi:2-C-methyl-D-erythritol 4-phosphate cytidylyltransferase